MPERSRDWMRQSERDLIHAQHSLRDCDFEWACFAAQQAAEKSIKSLYLTLHGDCWGHSILKMLKGLPENVNVPADLLKNAINLDKVYIPARYPDSFDDGSPMDYFTKEDAEQAINCAERIIEYAKARILEIRAGDSSS